MEIRVLHIVDSLNRGSGVMSVIMNLYRNIDRSKVQFDFLVSFDKSPNYEEELINMGAKVYHLTPPTLKNIRSYINEIDEFFNTHATYTIIHSHTPTFNLFIFPIAKKYGIKFRIAHSHNSKYSDKLLKAIRNYFMLLPTNLIANVYLACSNKAGEFLFGKKALKEGKVHIINNAIDCERFKYNEIIRGRVRKELEIENQFVIGHIGRFSEQKNHTFLIDVFYEVLKKSKNALLLLVGDGDLQKSIMEKVNSLNIQDQVKFLGVRSDINNLMQAMDVFVMPSLFEGLPVVGVEAQASGLPCIISDNVTKEIKVANVQFLSLRSPISEWAERILEFNVKHFRVDSTDDLRKAGFDIKQEAKKLKELYVKLESMNKSNFI
ncbi:glycosyltransferase family 1 protein [Paenibacillus sp. GP183]|uniref:glycosyltransferase family 1 protein n=1 Tax=Paenibacillus sp. GP183 TaxID=1882751 RepID=UPI0008977A96|nr:glycosyltransferase family 1 protein [Paenibacillus sp. GP183]SEC11351.1 Glycosyltransferase involved in cell wall bisynthesis [Paenibacillus sp. GP183]